MATRTSTPPAGTTEPVQIMTVAAQHDTDGSQLIPTLTGHEYSSAEVFGRERERIFHRSWFYVCRDDRLSPGDRFVADVAGESVLVVKDRGGRIHAHANVCRHRGARLCEESGSGSKAGITCPYHAWTYSLDGRLIGTPHLAADEVDRDSLSLWSVASEVWQGFVYVNLSPEPMPSSTGSQPEWIRRNDSNTSTSASCARL